MSRYGSVRKGLTVSVRLLVGNHPRLWVRCSSSICVMWRAGGYGWDGMFVALVGGMESWRSVAGGRWFVQRSGGGVGRCVALWDGLLWRTVGLEGQG